jgi:hypothetical protein
VKNSLTNASYTLEDCANEIERTLLMDRIRGRSFIVIAFLLGVAAGFFGRGYYGG